MVNSRNSGTRVPREVRLPVAVSVGIGSGLIVHRVLGLSGGISTILSVSIALALLVLLSRIVYQNIPPQKRRIADRDTF